MTSHRRTETVALYPGEYEQSLVTAMQDAEDAARREALAGGIRFGQRSPALAAAAKFDELRDSPPEPVDSVTLSQVGYLDWDDLLALHPPREDQAGDLAHGVDMSSFPRAVLHLSLVDPDASGDLAERLRVGEARLRALNPSRIQYLKLESKAWGLNNEDLNLPKESLVSLMTQRRGDDSEQRAEQG
jgi:hypothetical protein